MALDNLVKKIKSIPISLVLEKYIPILRHEGKVVCRCPFHDDQGRSMQLIEEKQIYFCSHCKSGGDAIHFLMRFKKLSFADLIEEISRKCEIR